VGALRQAKVSRAERKRRIVRAWRLQSVFLLASLLLPTFSFLLVNRGLTPFVASLEGLVDVNDQLDAKAFRGIEIADSMTALYRDLKEIPIVDIQSFCPNANAIDADANDLLDGLGMYALTETIQSGMATVDSFVMKYLTDIRPGLVQVTDATRMVDRGIESVYDSDWFLKLFLVALNVVNGFFIFGVFLSKISVVYSAFQAMLKYLLLPLFCLLLLGSVAVTCAAISMSLTNAGKYERRIACRVPFLAGLVLPYCILTLFSHPLVSFHRSRSQTFALEAPFPEVPWALSRKWSPSMVTRKTV
jgi:hypothetical protein